MDQEQKIRLNFLDEAQDCLDEIESVLIGLSSGLADTEQLDLALRASHSVKGGAGMMGFIPLSNMAHRIEDFFKILRVRYHSTQIATQVETLLLKSLDSLRQVSELHRQGEDISQEWLDSNVNPIFISLVEHLGEVRDEDENQLLGDNEDDDSLLFLVEEGMETIVDEFEQKHHQLQNIELAEELMMTAEKLLTLARMADLEPLIQLCESIQEQTKIASAEFLPSLSQQCLSLWQRSHGLIVRGSLDKLPWDLEGFETSEVEQNWDSELEQVNLTTELEISDIDIDPLLEEQLNHLEEFTQLNEIEIPKEDLADFSPIEFEPDLLTDTSWQNEDLLDLQAVFAQENTLDEETIKKVVTLEESVKDVFTPEKVVPETVIGKIEPNKVSKTIRVSVEQFQQFNGLFSQLVLERNRINLRLEQLKRYTTLMRSRMDRLELSNNQLKNWYDKASVEGILSNQTINNNYSLPLPLSLPLAQNLVVSNPSLVVSPEKGRFDALEMDRYSDLHLISQDQIETIVQLQEVSTDIETSLQEINQVVQELNQTSRALQGNITRTQMISFAEIVKPFPRLIRELSMSFDKQVNLKIEGTATLLDRAIIETLNAPLMHLMRNAFDHGIEDTATRIANNKWPEGTITLNAVNRGTQTILTISDDGAGINLDKIAVQIKKMGISDEQISQMSQSQMLDYIFQPGFTTTDKVTKISGRGVGMDVVKTSIKEVRGDISIDTKANQGTTFTIKVPYTLSILRVMLVERIGMIFAVPVNSIRQVFHLEEEHLSTSNLPEITWQDKTIPLVQMEKSLTFNRAYKSFEMDENPIIDKPMALIVGEQNNCLGGLRINRFWGEQEVSVRPIDSIIPLPKGFVSSIILGDGRVVPVINPIQILETCLQQQQNTHTENEIDGKLTKNNLLNLENTVIVEQTNKILIVDDSINVRRYLALTLEKAGYEVEQAKDGQEAVDKILSGLLVQAIICDIEMPRLDGYGVLEEIKGKSEFASLPIAMLTSRSNEKHRKLAMNLGAEAYFSKPYDEQDLLETIEQLINK